MRRMIPQNKIEALDHYTVSPDGYAQIYTDGMPDDGMPVAEFYVGNDGNPVMGIGGLDNAISANVEEGSLSIYNSGDLVLDSEGSVVFTDNIYSIIIQRLPTSDPHVAGALWNDNGTLKISSGS